MISFNGYAASLLEAGLTQFSTLQHEADGLSAGLPPLMVQADHLAASVSLGVHGRRRAGMGESFWQFRRYASHDSSSAIDWRQSAKSQHIFVREREWEAAQTVWFWRDASANMSFKSGSGLQARPRRSAAAGAGRASGARRRTRGIHRHGRRRRRLARWR